MCRWFAFISVNPVLLDDVLRRPRNAITQQILAEFQGENFLNADGFGISWHTDARSKFNPFDDDRNLDKQPPGRVGRFKISDGPLLPFVRGPHPAIYKTTLAKPLNDPSFLSLCANVSSKCIFAHLRAADDPPVVTTNNHPFVFGRHCFMHNGVISDFSVIRKDLLSVVSPGFACMIEGGTDTEHFAALYMTHLCDPQDFHGADKHYTANAMWKALKTAIEKVESIQKEHKLEPDNFLNIAATDGESMFALCYRTTVSHATPPIDLWLSCNVVDTLNRKPFAYSNGRIFRDNRSDDTIDEAAHDLRLNARRAVQRDQNNKVIGIEPELQRTLEEQCLPLPTRHGPHVVVSSEPTTIDPGWLKLCNRDVILVDTLWKEENQALRVSAETL